MSFSNLLVPKNMKFTILLLYYLGIFPLNFSTLSLKRNVVIFTFDMYTVFKICSLSLSSSFSFSFFFNFLLVFSLL